MMAEVLKDLVSMTGSSFPSTPIPLAKTASTVSPEQEIQKRIQKAPEVEQQMQQNIAERARVSKEMLEAQRAKEKEISDIELKEESKLTDREVEAYRIRGEAMKAEPEMKPSKMELDDYRNLAGMLIGIGSLVGGKGKTSAMYALSALDGMMKGYAEGRKDLVKQNQIEFDKALKAVDAHNKKVQKDFEEAVSLINKDRKLYLEKIKRLTAENKDSVFASRIALNDLEASAQSLQTALNSSDRALTIANQNAQKQEQREFQQAERMAREAFQAEQNRLGRELRRELKGGDRTLPSGEVRKLDGLDSIAKGLDELRRDFKPEFASLGFFGFGGEISLEMKRRLSETLGDKVGQQAADWWSKYNLLQAPNRHALFGATLTGNELQNYRSFTAKTSDSATSIKNLLSNQINYIKDTAESQRSSFDSAGYKVPSISPKNYFDTFSEDIKTSDKKVSDGWEIREKK